ncbi:hypothetical protein ACQ33O_07700 [Ferruginibacter sp. SUN002]|uniref:hypothetical protein n=1 Tax=Ferruginibacter sp. SUN002 TaxID=2937789 RepID=UPI003D36837F
MNRRNFLTKSSLAMIAAAGLPKAVFSNNPSSTPTIYKTKLDTGVAGQTYYELSIDHMCIDYLKTATDEQKRIILKIAYFETTNIATPTKGAEFNYIAKESTLTNKDESIWEIKTKFDKKVSGDYKLPKNFPKKMKLIGKKYSYFNIVDKNDEPLVKIPYPTTTSSGSGGCFLTTACVEHKKMADNCTELTALRFLRDEHMLKNENSISLISDYKIYGPQIVNAINACDNKNEIYDYMFHRMIRPSVALVKEGRFTEAIEYYKIFTQALAEKYL